MDLSNISIEDLKFLEEDLLQDELVSVAFLLFGVERPKWLLEKLKERQVSISLLQDYANYHDNWKSTIIEALGAIKAFECIQNLGIPLPLAREFVRKSSLINPCLKLLYQLCEACPKSLNDQLINFIKEECDSSHLNPEEQLELHFLHAITEEKIKITPAGCDFSLIKKFENITTIEDVSVRELLKKFPSKLNTLDTSANGDFNPTNREQNIPATRTEQIDVQSTNPLDNYKTKKMLALIINQQHFRKTTNIELMHLLPAEILTERNGTSKDMEALKKMFEDFNYQVIVRNDLTHVEIIKEVDKATKQSSKYDGLIVCVLSHGHEGLFYGSDSVPVFIKDIKENMSSKVLLNKPKILFIQACQGENLQPTVKKIVPSTEFDGPNQSNLISGSTRADFLTFSSTIEGFASVRHVENGSWFIQELVKKITELHKSQHLMDICTSVTKEVSKKRGYRDQCMLPKLESTFTKNYRFI